MGYLRTNQSYKCSGRAGLSERKTVQHPACFNLRHLVVVDPLPLSPPVVFDPLFVLPFLFPVKEGRGIAHNRSFKRSLKKKGQQGATFPDQTRPLVGPTGPGMLKWPCKIR